MCMPKLTEFLDGLQAQAPEIQAALGGLPEISASAQGAELALMAGGTASLSAAATAEFAAQMEAAAALTADLSMPSAGELAALEAMAQVSASFGVDMTAPSASMDLSLAAGGININSPALGELAATLPPLMAPMGNVQLALAIAGGVQGTFGVELTAPGASAELAASMEAAASAELAAKMEMAASFDVALAAELGTLARLANASAALGFDLSMPGVAMQLQAAIDASASAEVPPLMLSTPEWSNLIGLMSGFAAIESSLGVNLAAPGGAAALEAVMPQLAALSANLSATMDVSASASADLSAAGSLGASLSGALPALGADVGGAAAALSAGMSLGGAAELGEISLAASFAAAFEAATGISLMSSVPCPNMFCTAGG